MHIGTYQNKNKKRSNGGQCGDGGALETRESERHTVLPQRQCLLLQIHMDRSKDCQPHLVHF